MHVVHYMDPTKYFPYKIVLPPTISWKPRTIVNLDLAVCTYFTQCRNNKLLRVPPCCYWCWGALKVAEWNCIHHAHHICCTRLRKYISDMRSIVTRRAIPKLARHTNCNCVRIYTILNHKGMYLVVTENDNNICWHALMLCPTKIQRGC